MVCDDLNHALRELRERTIDRSPEMHERRMHNHRVAPTNTDVCQHVSQISDVKPRASSANSIHYDRFPWSDPFLWTGSPDPSGSSKPSWYQVIITPELSITTDSGTCQLGFHFNRSASRKPDRNSNV